ncbi:hypothetical protein LTR10_015184 [Elasticomyces elasticus]|uniref:Fe2OG dioxygenase domain-containing protein n=1 Tax=Exophiala sideris TaxID=1016849 RepID=A0ABR0JEB4_9EURO|nr:hypothetical protein LTR10_015184 [Elasticomyces elasticus]KAK5032658.1 hypothetical protein LTS07_004068 [Exophiala sideris]KAK5037161.1 hypothetical protein LTR13_004966 [Exophiala sideris]KAK5062183.1 hypothetical protein LTR69_004541 [Exophiala sideris]KAK5182319.1 hypothetical protein LTR44_005330 [Eurotiomycetes sp. CCFEE 6388]
MTSTMVVAPTPVAPLQITVTRPTVELPQYLMENASKTMRTTFDPATHLDFTPPKTVITMKDIGLEGHGISPVAVSEPFRLFTNEAIQQFRAEIFSKSVLDQCQVSSNFASNMIRAYAADYGPFAYSVWHHPEVLAIVSKVAGVDLTVGMDIDIGHVNVSINDDTKTPNSQTDVVPEKNDDDTPAFAWHYDSYPFVVVTMLSGCTDMKGGETALRTASGEIMKVRGATMVSRHADTFTALTWGAQTSNSVFGQGTAVILQGRYIEHQALKAWGGRERVSMVTSFRPKSPFCKDETSLAGLRGITDLSLLYHQYAEYRFQVLETRFRTSRQNLLKAFNRHRGFNLQETRSFLEEQKRYVEDLLKELVPYP